MRPSATPRRGGERAFDSRAWSNIMLRGDKSSYSDKQKRQASHIEEGYEERGLPRKEAERRAWATVNKETGGGKKSGSGRGKRVNRAPSRKGERRAATRKRRSSSGKSRAR
jgi:hypothetical protein